MTKDLGMSSVKAAESKPQKPTLLPSPGLGEWIRQQGGTIVFTTYQNSRLPEFPIGQSFPETDAQGTVPHKE